MLSADDVAKVLPGTHKETQKQGEEWAAKAGVKLDSVVSSHLRLRSLVHLTDACLKG